MRAVGEKFSAFFFQLGKKYVFFSNCGKNMHFPPFFIHFQSFFSPNLLLSTYFKCLYEWQNWVGFLRLDSGREPHLWGSESDMYTVHAQSKICPCLPPCTRLTRLRSKKYLIANAILAKKKLKVPYIISI